MCHNVILNHASTFLLSTFVNARDRSGRFGTSTLVQNLFMTGQQQHSFTKNPYNCTPFNPHFTSSLQFEITTMPAFTSCPTITTTDLTKLYARIATGKVRDLYELDENTLLFVATDRISAYDIVLKNGVPGKGALLTTLSAYWFSVLPSLVPELKTHFLTLDIPGQLKDSELAKDYEGRSMQVRKLEVLPIESIVRGYITGSAWSEYEKTGTVHGMKVKEGLKESESFGEPIWTPSTKAEQGEHDENISPEKGKFYII